MTDSSGTICLAVFRPNGHLLQSQIDSIRAQTRTDWRCVVGIDGQDREAKALVLDATADDDRFTVVEFAERVGFYRNFERILEQVGPDSQWIALSDQDDRWYPEKLATLTTHLATASLAAGKMRVVSTSDGQRNSEPAADAIAYRRPVTLASLMIDNQVTGGACVFRAGLLQLALPFPAPTDVAYHDHWLAVCALISDGVLMSDEIVQDYVQHAENVIGEQSSRGLVSRLRSVGGSGLVPKVEYLRVHRWGWRVGMARTALARQSAILPQHRVVLERFAADRLSLGLGVLAVKQVFARRAPLPRALALLIGAVGRTPRPTRGGTS